MENKNSRTSSDQSVTDNSSTAASNTSNEPKFSTRHKDRKLEPLTPKQESNLTHHEDEEPAPPTPHTTFAPKDQAANNQPDTTDPTEKSSKLETPQEKTQESSGVDVAETTGPLSTSNKKKKPLLWAALVLVLVLLVGVSYVAYAQYYMPRQAPLNYIQTLSNINSVEYDVELTSTYEDTELGSNHIELEANGKFQRSSEEIDFTSDIALKLGFGFFNMDLNLDLIYLENTLYAKTSDADFLAFFLPSVESDTWYHLEVDEDVKEDFMANVCSEADKEALDSYYQNELVDRMQITNPTRHDWFGVNRNGTRAQHYSGEIDGSVFEAIHKDMAELTSDDCMTYDDERQEYQAVRVVYNLYTARGYDELVLRVIDEDEEVMKATLTTQNYNQPMGITAPSDSQSLEDMLNNLLPDIDLGS